MIHRLIISQYNPSYLIFWDHSPKARRSGIDDGLEINFRSEFGEGIEETGGESGLCEREEECSTEVLAEDYGRHADGVEGGWEVVLYRYEGLWSVS